MAALNAMKPVWWMVGISLGSWLMAAPWFEPRAGTAMLLGTLGPLTMAVGSWVLTERTHRRNPQRVTAVMMTGFGVKMVFVGVYLVAMLKGLSIQPAPFVISFTTSFVVLYAIEAWYLKRLFAGGLEASR
jgi:hypothetical protein